MNHSACILNTGAGSWAFEAHAGRLSAVLNVEVSQTPRDYNYVLAIDESVGGTLPLVGKSFIPLPAIHIAADKRLVAEVFAKNNVPMPRTHLVDDAADVCRLLSQEPAIEWCVKYPTGCGAAGHRLITGPELIPSDWPMPYVVQEFIRQPSPEVYRLYAVGGKTFGWNARRFPLGIKPSPWVAHARGARYVILGEPPAEAADAATAALAATGLLDSFGCADLLRSADGRWLVLEVGTDGIYNHVDRDLGDEDLESEIDRRVADAFLNWSAPGRKSSPP